MPRNTSNTDNSAAAPIGWQGIDLNLFQAPAQVSDGAGFDSNAARTLRCIPGRIDRPEVARSKEFLMDFATVFSRKSARRQSPHWPRCSRAAARTSSLRASSRYSYNTSVKSWQFMMLFDLECPQTQKGSFPEG